MGVSFRTDEVAQIDERGEVRRSAAPGRVEMDVGELRSAEGDAVKVRATAVVRIADTEADRRMFRETLGAGRRIVRTGDFAGIWAAKVREALVDLALPAEKWLAGDAEAASRAQKVVAAEAYLSGLELLEPIRLEAASPAYLARVAEEAHRRALDEETARIAAAREAEAARRAAELQRAAELLRLAKEAGTEPDESARRAAESRAESGAGSAAESGVESGGGGGAAAYAEEPAGVVWCVVGNALLKLGAGGQGSPESRDIPAELGPLRSVSVIGDAVYIGARDGLWLVGETLTPFRDEPMATQHGFSETCQMGDILWSLHRQRGLVWWNLRGERMGCIRPAAAAASSRTALPTMVASGIVRANGSANGLSEGLTAIAPGRRAGSVLVVGDHVQEITADGQRLVGGGMPSRCLAVAEMDHRVAAVGEDGVIRWYEGPGLTFAGEVRLGEPVVAGGVWRTRLGPRLLAGMESGTVAVVDERGQEIRRLGSTHRGLKAITGNGSTIAGVSPDRMRVVLWSGDAVRELSVGSVARGRVADVAVA